jgi:hypothetical protein
MATPRNFDGRIKSRRQSALARREADIEKLTKASQAKDVEQGVLKKLDRAKTDVFNLHVKLGLKKKEDKQ